MPLRIDIGHVEKPVKTEQGYIRADAYLTRTGVFSYRMPDGSTIKELRTPEEVFNVDSMASFSSIALTNDHPPMMLDSGNTKFFQVGFTGEKTDQDGIFVKNRVTITDEESIRQVFDERKVAVSCGYHCDVIPERGEWKGETYDAIQKNIRGNHVSIVDNARAGASAKIYLDRMDKTDAVMVTGNVDDSKVEGTDNKREITNKGGDTMAVKINVDGIEYEVSERLADKIVDKDKKIDDLTANATKTEEAQVKAKADFDELQGKHDGLETELKKLQDEKPDMAAMRKTAKDRNELEELTKGLLGETEVKAVNFDEVTDIDLKKLCIKKVDEKVELKDASDEYVNGMFEIVRKSKADGTGVAGAGKLKTDLGKVIESGGEIDIAKLMEEREKKDSELWKGPAQKQAAAATE